MTILKYYEYTLIEYTIIIVHKIVGFQWRPKLVEYHTIIGGVHCSERPPTVHVYSQFVVLGWPQTVHVYSQFVVLGWPPTVHVNSQFVVVGWPPTVHMS